MPPQQHGPTQFIACVCCLEGTGCHSTTHAGEATARQATDYGVAGPARTLLGPGTCEPAVHHLSWTLPEEKAFFPAPFITRALFVSTQFNIADLHEEATLGSGSSGVVRRMRHKKTGSVYAMKVIPLGVEEQVQRRIVQELNILHDCGPCPHIVSFHEASYYDGAVCVVLEYMDGGSLADVVAHCGRIPERIVSNVAGHVARGLEFLHRKHLIHRDIKPSNVLLSSQGGLAPSPSAPHPWIRIPFLDTRRAAFRSREDR